MNLTFCDPAHSSGHQTSHMTHCTHISLLAHHQMTFLCNLYQRHPVADYDFLQSHWLGHLLTQNPFSLSSKPLCSLFPFSQAETILFSVNNLLIFASTENALEFQLDFLAGLGLTLWFSKSLWPIHHQAI